MLKENIIRKKPVIQAPPKKGVHNDESQNLKPVCFNTKGYFTADEPYDPEYLKVKQQVFKKYRKDDAELVFIDPKMTKPAAFIQRGMLKPNNQIYNDAPTSDKVLNNFLKIYINRKERREIQDEERYFNKKRESFGVSEIELNSAPKSSRPSTRSVYSRISTARSICSSANKEN